MENLEIKLNQKLRNAKKVVLLGVGSELRGDDGAGLLVAEELSNRFSGDASAAKLKILAGGTAPENFTGEIKKFKPSHLIIVDSADLKKRPGAAKLLKPDELGGISFCTHQLPLSVMIDYLLNSMKCDILIIGIQPEKLAFGSAPSKTITASAHTVSHALEKVLDHFVRVKERRKVTCQG